MLSHIRRTLPVRSSYLQTIVNIDINQFSERMTKSLDGEDTLPTTDAPTTSPILMSFWRFGPSLTTSPDKSHPTNAPSTGYPSRAIQRQALVIALNLFSEVRERSGIHSLLTSPGFIPTALTLINTSFSPNSGMGTSLRTRVLPWGCDRETCGMVAVSGRRTNLFNESFASGWDLWG